MADEKNVVLNMAHNYPKFLYQHVNKGTPGDGEFIVHLMQPITLFRVNKSRSGAVSLQVVEGFENGPDVEPIRSRATSWYIATQLKK